LQERSKICFDIAGIGAEGFLGGPFTQATRLKIVEELLAEIGNQALESPADRSFVNAKNARYLQECLTIKKVRSEQKTVLRRKVLKSAGDSMRESSKLGADRLGRRCLRSDIERVKRGLAMGPAVAIHMPLSQDRTEPAEKRATAGIGGQWRTALAIDLTKTIELGVK
jgi:hypothetical protein